MSNVNLINYSTREFTTKGEMDSYIRKQDEILLKKLQKSSLRLVCLGEL